MGIDSALLGAGLVEIISIVALLTFADLVEFPISVRGRPVRVIELKGFERTRWYRITVGAFGLFLALGCNLVLLRAAIQQATVVGGSAPAAAVLGGVGASGLVLIAATCARRGLKL